MKPKSFKIYMYERVNFVSQDMTIMNDDFTYSSTTGGEAMKYGTGGDCTYAHGCLPRKGYFHIDTSNTGLIVDKTVGYIHVALIAYGSEANESSWVRYLLLPCTVLKRDTSYTCKHRLRREHSV